MDYDFLDRSFLVSAKQAIAAFKEAVERVSPPESELETLCENISAFPHAKSLDTDFTIAAVDGSGEYPILQQDDVFVYFSVAAGKFYRTETHRQNKMATVNSRDINYRDFVVIRDDNDSLRDNYSKYITILTGKSLNELLEESDYCKVYSKVGPKRITAKNLSWNDFAKPRASEVGTHAYQIRTLAELGVAARMLAGKPKFLLLDTSLVYFLLGKSPYLPEVLKRYLISKANAQGTAIVGLCKSHNIPNGDLIGRTAREKLGLKDHWYLRLPSEELGERPLSFLHEKEIPPKLGVSYLFKFHSTSFPMRIDVDAAWWRQHIGHDAVRERQFFADLDYTCHDVRSYGYPYPMHAAHRTASLTKQERKAIRDILLQQAKEEGILRGAFLRDPEIVHQGGV